MSLQKAADLSFAGASRCGLSGFVLWFRCNWQEHGAWSRQARVFLLRSEQLAMMVSAKLEKPLELQSIGPVILKLSGLTRYSGSSTFLTILSAPVSESNFLYDQDGVSC